MLVNIARHASSNKTEGMLCVVEGASEAIPFKIKRVYYSYGVEKDAVRGFHAHKTLEQILICVYGSIEITLDYGNEKVESITLADPSFGLYVAPNTWRTMRWLKSDSVLLVLASDHYDEADYIRDYDTFVKWVNNKRRETP